MIFDSTGSIVFNIPQNVDENEEFIIKINNKFNQIEKVKSDIQSKKLEIGGIIKKEFKGRNIYYVIIKENYWDPIKYEDLL